VSFLRTIRHTAAVPRAKLQSPGANSVHRWLAALALAMLPIQLPLAAQTSKADADQQGQVSKAESEKQSQTNKAETNKVGQAAKAEADKPTPSNKSESESTKRLDAPSLAKASAPASAIAAIGPTIAAKAWVLYDVSSQQVLAAHEAEKTLDPASLTKLMTAYLSFSAIKEGRLKLDQRPPVSQKAWKAVGSRMFVDPGKPATVDELLKGMIVQSGNDASMILAETLAGSEEAFAQQMNREAQRIGLKHTQYRNSTGLPDSQHYSSAYDLALLASRLIREFPDRYALYSLREYSYNNIKQPNRNRLLAIDPSVDGLKTGHTDAAGWCLVASSRRKDNTTQQERRLISVVLGAASESARLVESQKLLNWGFQNTDAVLLHPAGKQVAQYKVRRGAASEVLAGFEGALSVVVPKGSGARVKTDLIRIDPLVAPIAKGQRIGTARISLDGQAISEVPLVALSEVPTAGWFGRAWDTVMQWVGL